MRPYVKIGASMLFNARNWISRIIIPQLFSLNKPNPIMTRTLAPIRANIVINRNAIPFDEKPPRQASGIRLGTPAITTRGMKIQEAKAIATLILKVLQNIEDSKVEKEVQEEVLSLTSRFPVPGIAS